MDDDELQRLLALAGDEDKAVRREAVERLRAGLPEVRDAVLDAATSTDWKQRASAVAVLDHAEQDEVVEVALRHAAADHDARVRDAAFHSLACTHCKPDGCLADDAVDLLVEAMLSDPSVRVRRKIAGGLMWAQQGERPLIVEAFRHILATDPDRVLRDRAATFLASVDVPRSSAPFREWLPTWERRRQDLLAAAS